MSHDQTDEEHEYNRLYAERPTTTEIRAERYILLARKGWADSRAGDNCFEAGDGEAVLALLFEKIRSDTDIRTLLVDDKTWLSNSFRRAEREERERLSPSTYSPGHPWYYVLGGRPLRPREILDHIRAGDYRGYLADEIEKVNNRPEPRRSALLREFKAKAKRELFTDLSRYRRTVWVLREHRKSSLPPDGYPICHEIHQSVCLKFNHLVNGFANLIQIEDFLNKSEQLTLFDFAKKYSSTPIHLGAFTLEGFP